MTSHDLQVAFHSSDVRTDLDNPNDNKHSMPDYKNMSDIKCFTGKRLHIFQYMLCLL